MTQDTVTRPEFSAIDVSGQKLLDAIAANGAAVIRNCIAPGSLRQMYKRTEECYRRRIAESVAAGQFAGSGQLRFGHIPPEDLDSPGERFSLIRFAASSGLAKVFSTLWDGNVAFLGGNCLPRRQVRGSTIGRAVPFHQDASFLGDYTLILNFWIPLVPCGVIAPGLEVISGTHPGSILQRPNGRPTEYEHIEIPEDRILTQFGSDSFWHPKLNLGDVFVFSNFTIHRTYETDRMTKPRISFELRCADARDGQLPKHRKDLVVLKPA